MVAEAVANQSGSGLTDVTIEQAVVLDMELYAWLDGGPWKRIMRERNSYSQDGEGEGEGEGRSGTSGRRGGGGRDNGDGRRGNEEIKCRERVS